MPDGDIENIAVLYDLEKDPFEEMDVSDQNERIYENMKVMLEQWCRKVEFDRIEAKNNE